MKLYLKKSYKQISKYKIKNDNFNFIFSPINFKNIKKPIYQLIQAFHIIHYHFKMKNF